MNATKCVWVITVILALMSVVTAPPTGYVRPCGIGTDVCTWDKTLPLGYSIGDQWGCNYNQNTNWPVNTDERVTCTFDGGDYASYMLYLSIDNDIISCTLNGNEVMPYTQHEGCAPADPRNGYSVSLSPTSGQNTLVCEVRDRGGIDHFDACVVGNGPTQNLPEFASVGVPLLVLVLAPLVAFALVRRKK